MRGDGYYSPRYRATGRRCKPKIRKGIMHHLALFLLLYHYHSLPFLPYSTLIFIIPVKSQGERKQTQSLDFRFPLLFPPLPLSLPHLLLFILLQNTLFFFLISSKFDVEYPCAHPTYSIEIVSSYAAYHYHALFLASIKNKNNTC